ncbi:ACT domain-containing protein [Algoriphagus halophilus]|uniref:ACT domain-containing protein n=1 Tax=Algoriphagus halophilus TaxID=226505 RepID=UPI00358F65C8
MKNEKGVLAKLLTLMSENDLDLSKIQSVPVIHKPWEYSFFIDTVFENHEVFKSTMEDIQKNFGEVKIFGEYISRK